jgi:hypothetical protein
MTAQTEMPFSDKLESRLITVHHIYLNLAKDEDLCAIENDLVAGRITPWIVVNAIRRGSPTMYRTYINRVVKRNLINFARVLLDAFPDICEDGHKRFDGSATVAAEYGYMEMFHLMMERGQRLNWWAFVEPLHKANIAMLDELHRVGCPFKPSGMQGLVNRGVPEASIEWLAKHCYDTSFLTKMKLQ